MARIGRLTWRREPDQKGLARVCQSPRGAILRWTQPNGTKKDVAHVAPYAEGFGRFNGWYWYGGYGPIVPYRNTSSEPTMFQTVEAAKADCQKYFRDKLANVSFGGTP